jgi:hypothetical protein
VLKRIALVATLLLLPATQAHAEYCFSEKITGIILVGDAVYFTTNKTCASWCEVNSTWSTDAKNRVYSTLLTAKTSNQLVSFHWPAATTACMALPTYSKPDQVLLTGP